MEYLLTMNIVFNLRNGVYIKVRRFIMSELAEDISEWLM